jgi:hypothetical protein
VNSRKIKVWFKSTCLVLVAGALWATAVWLHHHEDSAKDTPANDRAVEAQSPAAQSQENPTRPTNAQDAAGALWFTDGWLKSDSDPRKDTPDFVGTADAKSAMPTLTGQEIPKDQAYVQDDGNRPRHLHLYWRGYLSWCAFWAGFCLFVKQIAKWRGEHMRQVDEILDSL